MLKLHCPTAWLALRTFPPTTQLVCSQGRKTLLNTNPSKTQLGKQMCWKIITSWITKPNVKDFNVTYHFEVSNDCSYVMLKLPIWASHITKIIYSIRDVPIFGFNWTIKLDYVVYFILQWPAVSPRGKNKRTIYHEESCHNISLPNWKYPELRRTHAYIWKAAELPRRLQPFSNTCTHVQTLEHPYIHCHLKTSGTWKISL